MKSGDWNSMKDFGERKMDMWYLETGEEKDIVISTRIRLARNIDNILFVSNQDKEKATRVTASVSKILNKIYDGLKLVNLKDIDDITKMSLMENHIVSPEFAMDKNNVGALIINDKEDISIMLNEEDHIRIQVLSSGFSLKSSYNIANEIDNKISENIRYAYSEKYGFLTVCPTNIGTGLRASVMVHLPALFLTGNISKVLDAVNKMGMNIRGVYGEGTKSQGNIYQISNKTSLGLSEEDILNNLEIICKDVIDQERLARKHLAKNQIILEDKVYRAYGILLNAKIMTSGEFQELLSDVKLGVDMGIISKIDDKTVRKLYVYTKPANIQKYLGEILTEYDRDIKRAEIIKSIIKEDF